MAGPTHSEAVGPTLWWFCKSFPSEATVGPMWELLYLSVQWAAPTSVSRQPCCLQPDHAVPMVYKKDDVKGTWPEEVDGIIPMTLVFRVRPSTNWAKPPQVIILRLQNSLIWNLYTDICTTSSDNIILQFWKITASRAIGSILSSHILRKIRSDKMHHKLMAAGELTALPCWDVKNHT